MLGLQWIHKYAWREPNEKYKNQITDTLLVWAPYSHEHKRNANAQKTWRRRVAGTKAANTVLRVRGKQRQQQQKQQTTVINSNNKQLQNMAKDCFLSAAPMENRHTYTYTHAYMTVEQASNGQIYIIESENWWFRDSTRYVQKKKREKKNQRFTTTA